MNPTRNPEAMDSRTRREAEEKMHLRNLMESPSGRWILGRLIHAFEVGIKGGPRDCAGEYRNLIVKHFGHTAIDHILKG